MTATEFGVTVTPASEPRPKARNAPSAIAAPTASVATATIAARSGLGRAMTCSGATRIPEGAGELAAGGIAILRLFREPPGEHVVDCLRELGPPRRDEWRFLVDVRPENGDVRGPLERPLGREAFVEDAGQRIHVGARIDLSAPDLFGRHVVERPDDLVGGRQAADRARPLCQAEVGEIAMLATAGPGDEHVAGLDVAMDQPLLVGCVECARRLFRECDHALRVERALLGDEPCEVRAFHVAHREEEHSFGLARLEDRDDVRVVERGGDPRLAQEALPEALVVRELGRENLERNGAAEVDVPGAIDGTHAAAAEQDVDFVTPDFSADERIRTLLGRHATNVTHGSRNVYDASLADRREAAGWRLEAVAKLRGKGLSRASRPALELQRDGPPAAAIATTAARDFFSGCIGCQVYQPVWGMDLATLLRE